MAFCTNCGVQLEPGVHFCPNCGTPVTMVTPVAPTMRTDYKVVLISRGSCTKTVALDILSDLLGYTDNEAKQIVDNLPMATAIDLTAVQAQYIAQAMAEYGMEVAIYNSNGIVDMTTSATASVYDTSGTFLTNVAAVLAGLTIGNRITRYERWLKPVPVVFRPTYRRAVPLTSYRRYRPTAAPRPAP
ncbi:MAG: zinc-ribbon domain-containing protein, partial [Clostridia bacterium]|nr:zinc-ribbon domain-containing protein [Clostridia bacterium]